MLLYVKCKKFHLVTINWKTTIHLSVYSNHFIDLVTMFHKIYFLGGNRMKITYQNARQHKDLLSFKTANHTY